MEYTEFENKINGMIPELTEEIKRECKRLFNCGGVNIDRDDGFALPKIVLTVALENQSSQYMPFSKEYKNEVKNLRHF